MSKAYSVHEISSTDFDAYVAKKHPEANFLQSSAWARCYQQVQTEHFYLGVSDGAQELAAAALVILKKAKRAHYLEVPGGPLLDYQNAELLNTFLDALKALAQKHRCAFVRLRANLPDTPENRAILKNHGLKLAPMHLHAEHTVMLDLTQSEDALLKNMRRQTRYEIKRAQKLGIVVESSAEKSAFEDFYALQLETAKRQGFIPSPKSFILAQHAAFGEKAKIYTAKHDGQILAQGLILLQKPEAVYHEAASTLAGRKLPGAYALQWQVIRDAQKLGLARYNLFGIAPPDSPKHRYAGVTTFKTGFGGEIVTFLPAHDLVVRPLAYQKVKIIENIRKKIRHL